MPNTRVGDLDTHWESTGEGPGLLLIHGLGSSTRDWEYNQPAFAERYRTIVYDVRGHGQSAKPPGPYSVVRFAADAAGLLEAIASGPVHVVGVSMGGMIGLQLALDAPELVRSLTICNAGPELRFDTLRDRCMLALRLFIVRVLGMRAVGKKLAGEMFPKPEQRDMRIKVQNRWAENDRRCYLDSIRALVGWSVADRLEEIRCPVLLVRGDGDKTPMELTAEQLASMADARRVVIADSLHATPVDQAERFNQVVLDFLGDLDPSSARGRSALSA
jgi:pimeloyl-ACP methyl ester carboxylesterase